jgi:hypothetical protein
VHENPPAGRDDAPHEPVDPLATIWGPLVLAVTAACMIGLVLTVHYLPAIIRALLG